MNKKLLTLAISIIVATFIIGLFLIKFMWAWVVPDLFPGAVAQGLIAGNISWVTAIKLALFVSFMAAFANPGMRHKR